MPAALLLARVAQEELAARRESPAESVGPRRGEWSQSPRRRGVDRGAGRLIHRGDGMTVGCLIEAAESRAVHHAVQTSAESFDIWCRERRTEVEDASGEFTGTGFETRFGAGTRWGWLRGSGRRWRR